MNKHIYLIRGNETENYPSFSFKVFDIGKQLTKNPSIKKLKISITNQPPPTLSVIPFKKKKIAAISLYMDSEEAIPELVTQQGFYGAFKVQEAIPVGYEKTWKNGEQTPGVALLTLFHKRKDIDYQTFIDRWHNGHTPLSLELHPLWNYNRNQVERKLTDHDFWYDGIVEEHVRTREDLLNIFRFFGKPHKVLKNMMMVYKDSRSFIDYKRIEPYLVSEVHIID
jgi:hypothetical protein